MGRQQVGKWPLTYLASLWLLFIMSALLFIFHVFWISNVQFGYNIIHCCSLFVTLGWRLRKMLTEQMDTTLCREKLVKVLEDLQAQAEVGLCFVGIKHWVSLVSHKCLVLVLHILRWVHEVCSLIYCKCNPNTLYMDIC